MKAPRISILLCTFVFLIGLSSAPQDLSAQTFTGPELLCRPTDTSVTVNVVINAAREIYFQYGTTSGDYPNWTSTSIVTTTANVPIKVIIDELEPNTKYYYRMGHRAAGGTTWTYRTEHSFYTQRSPGSTFSFTITSDAHVNILLGSDSQWQTTLTNVAADVTNGLSDFHIDLGDTVAMDDGSTYGGSVTSAQEARDVYLFQRAAARFGRISHSASIFLVSGNHEQEEGWHLDDNSNPVNSLPVWGTNARKRYFPNPVPDAFYFGNSETYYALEGDQLREDYFAWKWGDALFIVLDPFWYTTTKPFTGTYGGGEDSETGTGDRWYWTLGETQYNWLRDTLENSNAKYKFIFMHHMTGGTDDYIREGAYAARYCEWGGYNEDGTTYAFGTRRPGWYAPIHQVLVENGVSAVFHGHDHQFAHEERDGVVYQALPAAGFTGNGFGLYNESDPLTIRVLPSSGHLRVTVSPSQATVNYVRSGGTGGTYSYTIDAAEPQPLYGDIEPVPGDCDVDGSDLAAWIADGVPGDMDVADFAENFGKNACP